MSTAAGSKAGPVTQIPTVHHGASGLLRIFPTHRRRQSKLSIQQGISCRSPEFTLHFLIPSLYSSRGNYAGNSKEAKAREVIVFHFHFRFVQPTSGPERLGLLSPFATPQGRRISIRDGCLWAEFRVLITDRLPRNCLQSGAGANHTHPELKDRR